MARKHFKEFEAISSAYPDGVGFRAVIGVKRRDADEKPQFHRVANDQSYALASEADEAAEAALTKVVEISPEGGLIWEEHAV
ncbi:hypothetical protein [Pseudomonas mangiferae]|uniref:Uncharacterized protein n=1 Tax=Pseudomonas mangiferae TaxID=2593654 RepID=A0A553H3N6_9PSED|nr:hypothetical protein [Pseudomonas mangiferae]TRX76347.1 hypothetical protein FM069_03930 [Pseudomonas mangiferae]